ncbi:MAG: IS3 family transposase [Deltaproteobacteria bacterium]|nr:IS3 family transposase [Deltaproteobacteria bacterium]
MYGARKVGRQMLREKVHVARCTVDPLMRQMGLQGVVRLKRVKTTLPADHVNVSKLPCNLVERDFKADAPNRLWVAD